MNKISITLSFLLLFVIALMLVTSQSVYAKHLEGIGDDHSCANDVDPVITSVTSTVDGAIVTWTQDPTRTGFGKHHVCANPDEFRIDSSSFSSTVNGETFEKTIIGLECETYYRVTITTIWEEEPFGNDNTSASESYTTLTCPEPEEPEPEPEPEPEEPEPDPEPEEPEVDPPDPELDDRDGDGVTDNLDECPDVAGTLPNGCPEVEEPEVEEPETEEPEVEEPEVDTPQNNGGGSGDNRHKTAPTNGISWTTFKQIVFGGFSISTEEYGIEFDITDNWNTEIGKANIDIGDYTAFKVKTYSQNGGLKIQELALGIPEIGAYNDAEVLIEVWYNGSTEIEDVIIIQDRDIVKGVIIYTEQLRCNEDPDLIENDGIMCYVTYFCLQFEETLDNSIIGIKGIDMSRRTLMPVYLTEGINISQIIFWAN